MADTLEVMPDLEGGPEEVVVTEGEPEEAEGEERETSTEDVVVEGEAPEGARLSDLERENALLRQEILKISSTLAGKLGEKEKPAKAPDDKVEKLSREDLKKIYEQYKDNPDVALRIMEHIAEEITNRVKVQTVEEERQRTQHQNMQQVSEKILYQEISKFPEHQRGAVADKTMEIAQNLNLVNHPNGLLAAFAILMLSLSGTEGKPKEEEGKGKTPEAKRLETIKSTKGLDKSREPSDKGRAAGKLTKEEMEIVRGLGIKPESYLKYRGA